jgi:hypothetical protein
MTMADALSVDGQITTKPLIGNVSGTPTVLYDLKLRATLANRQPSKYTLDGDAPVSVDFGGLTEANFIVVSVQSGGHVRARITSADGVDAEVPVDPMAVLASRRVPITALDLTRDPGVETVVEVYLGEYA